MKKKNPNKINETFIILTFKKNLVANKFLYIYIKTKQKFVAKLQLFQKWYALHLNLINL